MDAVTHVTTGRKGLRSRTRRAGLGWLILVVAAGATGATAARDDPTCPDTKASLEPAKTRNSGSVKCGFGLSLFGKGLGIFGPKCPTAKFIYPAHPACKGEANPGTRCTVDGKLEVKMQTCECAVLGVFDTGLRLPGCACKDAGTNGYVETGKTVDCQES
jgi:hypothetical protein